MLLRSHLKSLADAGLSFFYPPVCQVCAVQRANADEGYVCRECWSAVRFITPPFCDRCGLPYQGEITTAFQCSNCVEIDLHFRSARSAVIANKLLLQVIHDYKYRRALWFEPFLADLLIRQAEPILRQEHWNWIVPVPLHPLKKREREFNQAERLAVCLSRVTKIPVKKDLIRRVEATRTQTMLSRQQRAQNVHRAFAVHPKQKLNGEKIILLDDVLTTGATTNACARSLRQAGAGEICVWTVARGI
jgi:competence protein ComFC